MERITDIPDFFDDGDVDDFEINFNNGSIMTVGNDEESITNAIKEFDEIKEALAVRLNQLKEVK